MMKVHYLPYDDEESERAACKTIIPENGHVTEWWHRVTCKRCLKNQAKIEQQFATDEKHIVEEMGRMAAFFESEAK